METIGTVEMTVVVVVAAEVATHPMVRMKRKHFMIDRTDSVCFSGGGGGSGGSGRDSYGGGGGRDSMGGGGGGGGMSRE